MAESRDDQATGHFDWLGALLVGVAVGGLVFGVIYGEQRQWTDPLAFVSLGVGLAATISLPIYFSRARHPLVPLSMFRSRNFSATNLSTLLIYGALYVVTVFQPLFLIGTIEYTALAVGVASIPTSLFLVLLSTRFGMLASRLGPRVFMTVGPLLMAFGTLWLVRLPSTSTPWQLSLGDPSTYLPPMDYVVDVLPYSLVFGLGLAVMVAPLTTALMRSVPPRQAGLASAINNAISRVGPQLAGALAFVLLTASFYASLAVQVPGLDVSSPEFRSEVAPLNQPAAGTDPAVAAAAVVASTEAFHLAMLSGVLILAVGAAVNWFGISDRQALVTANSERRGLAT